MAKNGRFMVGLVGVAAVVTYLIWTGVSDTMVYYLTPSELEARILEDPTFRDVGVKVSGRVVPGSHVEVQGQLLHRFDIHDLTDESVVITVEYDNVLPDTFSATTVLTKCGSRYEASPEELANG